MKNVSLWRVILANEWERIKAEIDANHTSSSYDHCSTNVKLCIVLLNKSGLFGRNVNNHTLEDVVQGLSLFFDAEEIDEAVKIMTGQMARCTVKVGYAESQ